MATGAIIWKAGFRSSNSRNTSCEYRTIWEGTWPRTGLPVGKQHKIWSLKIDLKWLVKASVLFRSPRLYHKLPEQSVFSPIRRTNILLIFYNAMDPQTASLNKSNWLGIRWHLYLIESWPVWTLSLLHERVVQYRLAELLNWVIVSTACNFASNAYWKP